MQVIRNNPLQQNIYPLEKHHSFMNVVFLYKYLQIARTKLVNNKDSNSNNNTDSNNESYTKKKINRKGNIHRITTATTS